VRGTVIVRLLIYLDSAGFVVHIMLVSESDSIE